MRATFDHLLTEKSHDRVNCLYETNEDERNKIRKTLKEKHLLENEEMSEAMRSQIHYYENCLIHNRIPFADVRAAFDTAAENVLGTYHALKIDKVLSYLICRKKVLISNKKNKEKFKAAK